MRRDALAIMGAIYVAGVIVEGAFRLEIIGPAIPTRVFLGFLVIVFAVAIPTLCYVVGGLVLSWRQE